MTPTGLVPQYPIVNAGELYLNGLQLSMNSGDFTKHINVSRGAARDSKNVNDIILQSDTIARIERSGVNGLDTGLYASDTLYAVYIIGSSSNQPNTTQGATAYPSGILFSREFVRPYLPTGYDMFRRIGAVLTDVNGDLVPFAQTGNGTRRTMRYGTGYTLLTFGNATAWFLVETNSIIGHPIMPFIATDLYLDVTYTTPDLFDSYYFQPYGQPTAAYYHAGSAAIINQAFSIDVVTPSNGNGSFNYELDDNASSLSIVFRGYDDLL